MLKDEVKTVTTTPPQLAKEANPVDNLLKISFLRNYALPLIMRDPGLYDLDVFYDHPLLSFLAAVSPHYDGYESAFQQYEKETHQVYLDVRLFVGLLKSLNRNMCLILPRATCAFRLGSHIGSRYII
jgi:hypothetical protein